MHSDAAVGVIYGGEEGDDIELAFLAHLVERPGAVFSTTPGEPSLASHVPACKLSVIEVRSLARFGLGYTNNFLPNQRNRQYILKDKATVLLAFATGVAKERE
jgi:hypothetical protein